MYVIDSIQSHDSSSPNQRRWWTLTGDDCATAITFDLSLLKNAQTQRLARYTVGERLYGSSNTTNRFGPIAAFHASISGTTPNYNLVQSCADTLVSKFAKNRPRPFYITSNGKWRNRTKAKALNALTEGVFNETGLYDLGVQAVRDSTYWGDGFVYWFEKNKRVACERVMASEIWVDEMEAYYGKPRSLHRVKAVDRAELTALFPEKEAEIKKADKVMLDVGGTTLVADLVLVRESWHLRSSPDAEDGVHVISLNNRLLSLEEWEHDFFPFARFRWGPAPTGYFSQSLAEQLKADQFELNGLLAVIQRSFRLAGGFRVFLPIGAKTSKAHFSNEIGTVIPYSGDKPPHTEVIQPLHPDTYAYVERIIERAYRKTGVSQLSASSMKPAGLNSGKALREMSDIESDRFQAAGKEYDSFFTQCGKIAVAIARQISEREGGYEVHSRSMTAINWADIDPKNDAYDLLCFSINSLSREPAGRIADVTELAQAGYVNPREAQRLLAYPDIDQVQALDNADEEYLTKILDEIVDDGTYTPPEPYDDLAMAAQLARSYYAQAKSADLEEDRLELLRTFMAQVDSLSAPPPDQMQPAGPAGPGATPMGNMPPGLQTMGAQPPPHVPLQ